MRGGHPAANSGWADKRERYNGITCVMNEMTSDIKPSALYSNLSKQEIAEMMAECAKIDALFQSGQISTLIPTDLTEVAYEVAASAEADTDRTAKAA